MNCEICGKGTAIALPSGRRRQVGSICIPCLQRSWPRLMHGTTNSQNLFDGKERTTGIEIELNVPPKYAKELIFLNCDIHEDGSLRGEYPLEIVSPVLSGKYVREWLDSVKDILSGSDNYKRTGLHIWKGINSWWACDNLLKWGQAHEAVLARFVAKSRKPSEEYQASGAPMRVPPTPQFSGKKAYIDWLYGPNVTRDHLMARRINDQRSRLSGARISRYWWLNVHPFWAKKAIEIRLHQGTMSTTKIEMWCKMWDEIVSSCETGLRPWREIVSPEVYKYFAGRAWTLHGTTEAELRASCNRAGDYMKNRRDSYIRREVNPKCEIIITGSQGNKLVIKKTDFDARIRFRYLKKKPGIKPYVIVNIITRRGTNFEDGRKLEGALGFRPDDRKRVYKMGCLVTRLLTQEPRLKDTYGAYCHFGEKSKRLTCVTSGGFVIVPDVYGLATREEFLKIHEAQINRRNEALREQMDQNLNADGRPMTLSERILRDMAAMAVPPAPVWMMPPEAEVGFGVQPVIHAEPLVEEEPVEEDDEGDEVDLDEDQDETTW